MQATTTATHHLSHAARQSRCRGRYARRVALLASVALSVVAVAPAARAQGASAGAVATNGALSLDIRAQPLGAALTAFADQAGLRLLFPSSLVAGRTSAALVGRFTREEALARLLGGTGLSYAFTGPDTVRISAPASSDAVAADGSMELGTIDVNAGTNPADLPYETPGSTNYISSAEIERFPPQTAGALFQGTPGVISGGGNNGASIDPNIRGLQGMNRVATTVDGAQQSTSSYRGYSGVDSRTYLDPDLVSGVTITKGPDGAVAGAIGGTIAMETLNVEDLLIPGDAWGVRLRMGVSSNNIEPVIGQKTLGEGDASTEISNGSVAFGSRDENVDFVAAFVRRTTGNYNAGTNGSLTTVDYLGDTVPLSNYGYGEEVYNTSEDATSGLLKVTMRPTDEQEIQIGYLYYGNDFGEVSPSLITAGSGVAQQLPLSSVEVNQATLAYTYRPIENDLIDVKVNAYASMIDETNIYGATRTIAELTQQSQNAGVSAQNTSHLDIVGTPAAVTFGASYAYEDAQPTQPYDFSDISLWAIPADGVREVGSVFGRVKWEPTSWLALAAGLEYLTYDTTFNGTTTYNVPGEDFSAYAGSGISPSASITVTPLEGWQIYAQYQSGIRPLSVREVSQTRSDQIFNPDLEAEQASNWEFGTNLLRQDIFTPGDKARLKLAYFDNTTDNYVGRQFNGSNMFLFNYDFVRFAGYELSGGYDTGRYFVEFGLNYYTDFEACQQDHICTDYTLSADYLTNQIPPRFTASLTAGARFFDERLTVGGRVTYMGERLAEVREDGYYFAWVTKQWEPYTVIDAFAQFKINSNITLDVSVQNLTDAYYVDALNNTDMPAPGRTFMLSLTGTLGGEEKLAPIVFPRLAGTGDWTGLYVGGHFAYGFGEVTGETTTADGSASARAVNESADQSFYGGMWGGQIGYNYQFANNVVLGVEADFSYADMGGSQQQGATEGAMLITRSMLESQTDYAFEWLATLRGRLGYAFDDLMVYGTGGVAFLRENEQRSQYIATTATAALPAGNRTDLAFTDTDVQTRTGFALGAGAEYAINSRWSVKAEYLYTGFGSTDFLFGKARAGVTKSYSTRVQTGCRIVGNRCVATYANVVTPGTSDTVNGRTASNEAELQLFRIGLNYRF
ncbi:TonB-dependent receptor domain-containing protein [Ancylobacter sp. SL191]|uniref:TonB-dependent receptor domain-containing protein n=1 Tax=Ancylobacter sp. SL191 TaxID=2995166 RepID=UPI00226FCB17|nr:TonB-dependent receptor [Ancylobacter sp. SL191]WAC26933.1 TonB-dependent receptor [Ancylobacter sp. SL191]